MIIHTLVVKEKVKVKVAEAKHIESDKSVHPLSIDDDPLNQVFPKKLKGGVPDVGSYVTRSQYDASLHAHIMYSNEKSRNVVMMKKYERMEKQLESVTNKLEIVVDFCTKLSQGQVNGGTSIPMIRMRTSQTPTQSSTMKSVTSPLKEPNHSARLCELLDWEDNCVAIAKEVTDLMHRANCHKYVLDPHVELKVSMVSRKILQAKLYKAWMNPEGKIVREVGIGDFLVWPKSHIKYMEQ